MTVGVSRGGWQSRARPLSSLQRNEEPNFCQLGRGKLKEITAFDKANFVIGRNDSYSRAPTIPERSRIVEVTVDNILQQNMREIVYVLLRFSPTFRKFQAPARVSWKTVKHFCVRNKIDMTLTPTESAGEYTVGTGLLR